MMDKHESWLDHEMMDHLRNSEVEEPLSELKSLHMERMKIAGKIARSMRKLTLHHQSCGYCLSRSIANGELPLIEEYYEEAPMRGEGRLPKLHYMLN